MPDPAQLIRREQFFGLRYDEISEQIELRRVLLEQMVGNLYPSILRNEIADLVELQHKSKLEIIVEAALGDE